MAQKQRTQSFVIMCLCVLALPPAWADLSCCRRVLSNGSASYQLSNATEPTCSSQWSADRVVVVDESGETDPTRVLHAGPQELILKGKHSDVIFRKDCTAQKNGVMLTCNDPCQSSDEATTAPAGSQRANNGVIRSRSDGVSIFISILLIITADL